jgi:Fe2+ transport system protein FeoA
MTTPDAPLRDRLKPRVLTRYEGFERHRELSDVLGWTVRVYAFGDEDCRAWYRRFADDVIAAVDERRYLPVYRMGDGEFSFALGSLEEVLPWRRLRPRQMARRLLKLLTGRSGEHRSGAPGYGWEVYSPAERRALVDRYAADLAAIARQGYLALALDESPLYSRFLPYVLDWLDARGIALHAGNYQHVYAMYALLHGPDRHRLLRGRRVLVVNAADASRREVISRRLMELGVAGVEWIEISRDKAMLDRIDLGAIGGAVDLALVGAGVGAANVLAQLAPLGVPALDVGFVLDVLADPELRWNRPFCVADDEFDVRRIRFLEPADHQRLLEMGFAARAEEAEGAAAGG